MSLHVIDGNTKMKAGNVLVFSAFKTIWFAPV